MGAKEVIWDSPNWKKKPRQSYAVQSEKIGLKVI